MKMKMEEWRWMVLRGFMLVGVQERRFHEGQQKHNARQDGSDRPHGNYLISHVMTAVGGIRRRAEMGCKRSY